MMMRQNVDLPRKMLCKRDCFHVHIQRLSCQKFSNFAESCRNAVNTRRQSVHVENENALASLDKVVVYGCPPPTIRICNRVSLKSLPATPLAGAAAAAGPGAADVLAALSGTG